MTGCTPFKRANLVVLFSCRRDCDSSVSCSFVFTPHPSFLLHRRLRCNNGHPAKTTKCMFSKHGCCPDNVAAALGPGYLGCPGTCGCNKLGSIGTRCDPITKQCQCKPGVGGLRCERFVTYFEFTLSWMNFHLPSTWTANEDNLSGVCVLLYNASVVVFNYIQYHTYKSYTIIIITMLCK